jgi:nucleotide-binding universal stress UspA family protein
MSGKPKILVYTDGSDGAYTAMEYAIYMARTFNMQLFGIYVANTKALQELVKAGIFVDEEQDEYRANMKSDAYKFLNELVRMGQEKGVTVESLIGEGSIHRQVAEMVKLHGIHLLVIGDLSPIRSKRDELHDEMERTLRAVKCSVLVVKDPEYVSGLYNNL